jgi:hypothetical protein
MDPALVVLIDRFDEVSAMWTRAKRAESQQNRDVQDPLDSALEEWLQWTENFVRTVQESSVDPASLGRSFSDDRLIPEVDWNAYVDEQLLELSQVEALGQTSDRQTSDRGLDGLLRVWETEALVRCGVSPSRAWEFAGFLPSLKETRGRITRGVIGPLGLVMSAAIGSVRQWMGSREVQTWQVMVRVLGASRVIAAAGVLVEADSLASETWNHPIAGLSQIMGELKAAAEAAGLDTIED